MKHRLGDGSFSGFVLGALPLTEQSLQIQPQVQQGPPLDQDQDLAAEKIWADAQLAEAQMYADVAVPEGDFSYAPPVHREIDFKKRHPHEWFNTELPPMKAAFKFLKESQGRVFMDEAISVVDDLGTLLYTRRPDGDQSILLEVPFKRWVQGDSVMQLISDFRDVYEAKDNGQLREDNDTYGTSVSLAYCDGRPFVLTVRSEVKDDLIDGQVITRQVVAEKVDNSETVMNAANQLSLREQLRVKHLLTEWGVSAEHLVQVNKLANRRTVQSDNDVRLLLSACQIKESRSQRMVSTLKKFIDHVIIHPGLRSMHRNADLPPDKADQGKHRKRA